MSEYINLNGIILQSGRACLPHDNRGLRYGYGLFETMLLHNGIIQHRNAHWARLSAGMKILGLQFPAHFNEEKCMDQILKTAEKNALQKLARIRLQIFAGGGGLYDGQSSTVHYLIESFGLSEEILQWNENGLVLGIAPGLRKSNDMLANLKTSSALMYAMAAQQAKEQRWNDALIRNTAGNIIESTIANLFCVKNTQIITPPLSEGCVAGIMRQHLLETLPGLGYNISEMPLTEDMLYDANEVFLTNAIRGIKWVGSIGDKVYHSEVTAGIAAAVNGRKM